MDTNRVYAGLIVFCLLVSAGLYYLSRWRRLPTKTVKAMAKIFLPTSKVFSIISGIGFVGGLLLIVFDYHLELATRLMFGTMVVVFALLMPVCAGYTGAYREVTKRERAEERQEENEELAAGG